MKTADSEKRRRKIIILTVIFGVLIGLLSLAVHPKPDGTLDIIIALFTFPFCTIAKSICIRTGMCSIVFDFYDKIGFLLVQSLVYLVIGYWLFYKQGPMTDYRLFGVCPLYFCLLNLNLLKICYILLLF